jgi:hypothetical protein
MKKILLAVAAVLAMSAFSACNNGSSDASAADADSIVVAVDSIAADSVVVVDSVAVDSVR